MTADSRDAVPPPPGADADRVPAANAVPERGSDEALRASQLAAAKTMVRRSPKAPAMVAGAVVVALVLVTVWFWWDASFQRALDDEEIGATLAAWDNGRGVQHALAQLAERFARADDEALAHVPALVALVAHPLPEVRRLLCWTMGEEGRHPELHTALLTLLRDDDARVRGNAALALTRFGDGAGRAQLRAMLKPYTVPAPLAGAIDSALEVGDRVREGMIVARIAGPNGAVTDVLAPLPGELLRVFARPSESINAGAPLVKIAPSPVDAREALRALFIIGTSEDLPAVEAIAAGRYDLGLDVRQQADATARQIRARADAAENAPDSAPGSPDAPDAADASNSPGADSSRRPTRSADVRA